MEPFSSCVAVLGWDHFLDTETWRPEEGVVSAGPWRWGGAAAGFLSEAGSARLSMRQRGWPSSLGTSHLPGLAHGMEWVCRVWPWPWLSPQWTCKKITWIISFSWYWGRWQINKSGGVYLAHILRWQCLCVDRRKEADVCDASEIFLVENKSD